MNPPLIKIEVEHMRQSMIHAFSEHILKMDGLFQHAINEACKPEIVQELVDDAARRYLRQALEEEVKDFFTFGAGKKIVKAQIEKKLKADLF